MKNNLKEMGPEEITQFIERQGLKPYRARQIINWIYRKRAVSFDDMTDLSRSLRDHLSSIACISSLIVRKSRVSQDGTCKLLLELDDRETVESVLIPNSLGHNSYTICISSQVGCSMGCKFCRTASIGLKRNLKAFEIYDQVMAAMGFLESRSNRSVPSITNIVFMGMGEPFMNIKEVIQSLWILTGPMGFSKRRVTVSTSGVVPGFQRLAEHGPDINLAVSLNATTDNSRDLIMPINKKYPVRELLKACRKYPLKPNRSMTIEYVMLKGVNDTEEDAFRLVKLLKGVKAKVNLIPYNAAGISGSEKGDQKPRLIFKKPTEKSVLKFQEILHSARIITRIRKSKGADISAACGQLKAMHDA